MIGMVRAQRGHEPDLLDGWRSSGELFQHRGILTLGCLVGRSDGGGTTHSAPAVSEDPAVRGRNQVKKSPNLCQCRRPAIRDRQFRVIQSQVGKLLGIVALMSALPPVRMSITSVTSRPASSRYCSGDVSPPISRRSPTTRRFVMSGQ
jgi:hypothetical protein